MQLGLITAACVALTLGGAAGGGTPAFDEGQGSASDHATIVELSPGRVLLGAAFESSAALGRVVVVEIGGS